MSRTEREKVFLEVHVQNLTSEPLCFEKMKLDCVDGWTVEDANLWDSDAPSEDSPRDSALSMATVFSGAMAIMQPQDTRQYLFILSPKPEAIPEFPVIHQPGSVIPLGRLDISWRTGRLLTSVRFDPYNVPMRLMTMLSEGAITANTIASYSSPSTRDSTSPPTNSKTPKSRS